MRRRGIVGVLLGVVSWAGSAGAAAASEGYYRFPAIHGDTVVFTAEGDLWTVPVDGGLARRLTTHAGQETRAAISPDGQNVAFSAEYEGGTEVYVMPLAGGQPRRLTWDGERAHVAGWTPRGEVLYTSQRQSTLPQWQLLAVDSESRARRILPLAQATEGAYSADGQTLFFTRLPFQGSFTKRYRGGTAQNLWSFAEGDGEARPLTADFPGTSRWPMVWRGRVVFASDRDGTMNLWSMDESSGDLRQLTRHVGWDVKTPSLEGDRVVYQQGADLRLFDLVALTDRLLPISLPSDFEQRREQWLAAPLEYLTSAHLSPDGERVVLTARGQVFVVPVKAGRLVEASRKSGVRYRAARFFPDGKSLSVLSDESGEVELWELDPRGVAPPSQRTQGATTLRFEAVASPDGKKVAVTDKNQTLRVVERDSGAARQVATSAGGEVRDFAWSPDSRWLAVALPARNFLSRLVLVDTQTGESLEATSDRFDSYSPSFSPDGKFLYFLSDRHLQTAVPSPWGSYAPQPFLDRRTRLFGLVLATGVDSPFQALDELHPAETKKKPDSPPAAPNPPPTVTVEPQGLAERLFEVPVAPGNYGLLVAGREHLFFGSSREQAAESFDLLALPIGREGAEPTSLASEVEAFELSASGEQLLLRREKELLVIPATGEAPKDLTKHRLDLSGWSFALDPREEWRQMLTEAWRLLRDYFYDPAMHGVDWPGVLAKYRPLVDRVADRAELSDLFGEMSGELSALHHAVRGGDVRKGDDQVEPASLGAELERDPAAGGYRVARLYAADPDLPEEAGPLARWEVGVRVGDVITAINGTPTLSVPDVGGLLRNQADKQVLLSVAPQGRPPLREVIVKPLSPKAAAELRYDAWEKERRLVVDTQSGGSIGYVHLRAMNGGNYSEWARHFFPVFDRAGLIVDLRHNRGGNIDSWILGSLLRRVWMWWAPRVGATYPNMQFAFRGHVVVLVDEFTASDGEAFAEGFKRLGLGKVIGTRTWGGEIWLTASNLLVDGGIAAAAEFGVFGPEGQWLIEGHGVEPDVVVDNLPHATFKGQDAQLEAAVAHLQRLIREDPRPQPPPPSYPDKSFRPAG